MVDLGWVGLPNWIAAVASLGALVVAGFAGYWASKAASYTKEQAEAAHRQVTAADGAVAVAREQLAAQEGATELQLGLAHEQLELAQAEGVRVRAEAEWQRENTAKARLDALAPSIFVTGKPNFPPDGDGVYTSEKFFLECRRRTQSTDVSTLQLVTVWTKWIVVDSRIEVDADELFEFRCSIDIACANLSDRLAQIHVAEFGGGITDLPQGEVLVVLPKEHRQILWTREVASSALRDEIEINEPNSAFFRVTIWARDLGLNVRDTYMFNGDLRFFERDGSRLIVNPEPPRPWNTLVAELHPDRVYERLAAQSTPTPDLTDRLAPVE